RPAGTGARAERIAARRAARPAEPAHEFLEDILGAEASGCAAARAAAGARGVEPAEAGKFWIALGVDLAAVILSALGLVRQQVIGRGRLREFGVGVLVGRVLVGMQRLGQLAIGALDLLVAGAFGHPQYGIRIAHALG